MTGLPQALAAYQAGRLDEALALALLLRDRPGAPEPMAEALIGTILLKHGDRAGAAHAFCLAAEAAEPADAAQAAHFLKLAATLAMQAGESELLSRIGLKAARANLADRVFVLTMAKRLLESFTPEAFAAVEELIPALDRANGEALHFAAQFYRARWNLPALKAVLDEAERSMPQDVALAGLGFLAAHDMADLAAIARHQALMHQPDTAFAATLLAHEPALARLVWCDDAALLAKPVLEQAALAPSLAARPARRALRQTGKRLHIGYLSSDFSAHATMTLFLDSLLAHDRERFEITLFCHTPEKAAESQRHFPDLIRKDIVPVRQMSDAEAAAEIDAHGVDILVDLKGHTPGARLAIVNLSSAPVKATYLGFPGPVSGVDLDYAIVDPVIAPESDQPFYRENFCRLPDCYQANSAASRPRPAPACRADHGLPDDRFVFASFNGVHKITPETLRLWAGVLQAVPDSLFWLLAPEEIARANLIFAFAGEGIGPERLIFADRMDYADHVSRLALADLALDTFPYNGHTTTSDMLWAGLPVLTKRGSVFAARVSESLLRAAGLPELVAGDAADFITRAQRLADNPQALTHLRQRLKDALATAPLFDSARFTRHLERAYEMMAERARQGLEPAPIDVFHSTPV
ncbi:hypothetical protein NAC44_05750 [Allorhizobium sp. BGMRC 0089]|uniref:O-linked N-acetylglucosamine transferase, SPINDLY family protein n=1 Tax=Allorhizobium sonneratiae TaxID=2934936 RepID=UPI0020340D8B|nr:hypothetical protein [Allorhizobium sonneratiae]MCM2291829.1 hypothetical protein [Allorhizobium sonneratiae]